ncbi:hypothetical protein BGZ59_005194 [Podila verticillata]|nr:hypothetical protein BGZ59_005194 [Podila verticillata]
MPFVVPAPSPSSVPYPVSSSTNSQQLQPQQEVTFVDATPIDTTNKKYKMSATAGGSTFTQDLRNPKKKAFWILNIIFLSIIFGVLGATVWKRDSNDSNDSGNTSNRKQGATTTSSSSTRPVSSNSVPTSVVPVVPTPVIPTTPAPVPVPKPTSNPPLPPPPRPTGGGSGGSWACDEACAATSRKCEDNCRATDPAYKSCNAKCSSSSDTFCEFDCESASGCFRGCDDVWGQCAMACG